MSGTTTALLPCPPTTHTINDQQRNKLIRSTRKLGAVLGTTPQVAEPAESKPISLLPIGVKRSCSARPGTPHSIKFPRHQGSVSSSTPSTPELVYISSSNNSSVTSLALSNTSKPITSQTPVSSRKLSTKSKRAMELPRPLVLRLNAVPAAPAYPNSLPTTPSTAQTLTPTSTPALTPLTPLFPSPAESRRKRMAKLTRTLGEIIPPHLVFASKKPSTSNLKSGVTSERMAVDDGVSTTRKRRSMSVDFAAGESLPPFSRSSRVWVTGNAAWRGEWNRKDIKDVQKQLRSLKAS